MTGVDVASPGRSDDGLDVDAILVLSFGGPEAPDEVMPFLENVTRGRGVPRERLADVAEHYYHFGGVSPINEQGRALVAALGTELASRGAPLPVYFGNRNWRPYVEDVLRVAVADGHRRIVVLPTSAWGGYSGCRQYDEDIARALASLGSAAEGVTLRKAGHYWDRPGFAAAVAAGVVAARAELPEGARVVFTAHSVPVAADDRDGRVYSTQVAEASRRVAELAGVADYDLVWQSRSGPPQVPWLEPDIVDHLETLDAPGVLVCPIGFISDHLEVVWDLDTEAREAAAGLHLSFVRAATVGTHPAFVAALADHVLDVACGRLSPGHPGVSDDGARCSAGCGG